MPMALEHFVVSVNFFGQRAMGNFCRPRSQTHARAFVSNFALLIEQTDHWFGSVSIKLRAVCFFNSADVARELNRRHLHSEAQTQIRNFVFPSETCRAN